MSFLSNIFGKSRKNLPDSFSPGTPEEKPIPEPARGGTTLRKQEEAPLQPESETVPELSALEMAERQSWKVKTLPMWKPGDEILGLYRVEDVLEGGMGRVYVAHHKGWNVKLAIKSPNEMMLSDRNNFARVLREADSWIELGLHPNIAYCYYVRSIEDIPHIFVEYVDGGNLRQWIADGKCIGYRVSLDLAIQFCHGMEWAHSKGMIHRDIKPENVLITKEGQLKITDFGLVRTSAAIEGEKGKAGVSGKGMTRLGDVMGTEGFMAPEQFEDPAGVDERADIFSFGVCLYEMFCGNRPYSITYGKPQDAPDPVTSSRDTDFHPALAELLTMCVQWQREARFGNFEEIRQVLIAIHLDLYGEKSPYAELELVDLEADSLNNRGVSYLELGKKQEAISCFEKALLKNETHPEAVFNKSLIQWRDAKIADDEVLRRLDNCGNNPKVEKKKIAELKALIHEESFNPKTAREILKEYPGKYDNLFLGQEASPISMLRILEGHTDNVYSVTITPDGRYAVSGSRDETLKVWDIETRRCLRTLEGHTSYVASVVITPDSRYAVSGSYDETIRVWDLETGRCLRTLEGHTSYVASVVITPDSRYAVSGSEDGTLRVWDIETGRCLRTLYGHASMIDTVTITSDGKYAVSGSRDKTLKVWELETGRCLRTLEGHTSYVSSVTITPDGLYAISTGSWEKALKVWELETGRCLRTLYGHTAKVNSVTITPVGRYAVSGGDDKTLRVWELETGRCLRTIEGHTSDVESVTITPDGQYVVSGGGGILVKDCTLRVWEFDTSMPFHAEFRVSIPKGFKQRKKEDETLNEKICAASELYRKRNYKQSFAILYQAWRDADFSNNDLINKLYTKLMKKGDIKNIVFTVQNKLIEGHALSVMSVATTSDGKYAVSGSEDKTLRVWELETGRCLRTLEGHTGCVMSVAITPDGRYAVSGSWDKNLRVWELETGRCIRTLHGHTNIVFSVAITPDGRYAVSGSGDRTLKVWGLETGQCLRTLASHGHTSIVPSVAITPDGRYAVSGSDPWDRTLKVWELETGRCLRTLEGHTHSVTSVTITFDGQYAISAGENLDKTLRVWELETGRCLRTLKGHTNAVCSVTITSDGKYAVSGSRDNTLKVWELETGRCLRTLYGHTATVNSVTITPDNKYAVSGSNDHTLRVWRLIWDLEFD